MEGECRGGHKNDQQAHLSVGAHARWWKIITFTKHRLPRFLNQFPIQMDVGWSGRRRMQREKPLYCIVIREVPSPVKSVCICVFLSGSELYTQHTLRLGVCSYSSPAHLLTRSLTHSFIHSLLHSLNYYDYKAVDLWRSHAKKFFLKITILNKESYIASMWVKAGTRTRHLFSFCFLMHHNLLSRHTYARSLLSYATDSTSSLCLPTCSDVYTGIPPICFLAGVSHLSWHFFCSKTCSMQRFCINFTYFTKCRKTRRQPNRYA